MEEKSTSGPRVVEAPLRSQQVPVSSGSSSSVVGARSDNKLYVKSLCADILNPRIGWTPQVGTPIYIMEQTTMQTADNDHDDQFTTYLCAEGMHRVMTLKMAGYDNPVRFTLVRQLSVDDMIFIGARLKQQGDKRCVGNLISQLEIHRRALECIVEKELQKRQDSGPKVRLEIANKVKPSDIWHFLDPHDY